MGRIILGVIVGFVAWSIIWVGGDEALASFSGGWYSTNKLNLEKAAFNKTEYTADSFFLLINLIRSVFASLLSGFLAAFVASENRRTTMILGVLLLVVGIIVQAMVWNLLPVWYHLAFLLLLIPVTIAGGYLKKTA